VLLKEKNASKCEVNAATAANKKAGRPSSIEGKGRDVDKSSRWRKTIQKQPSIWKHESQGEPGRSTNTASA